MSPLAAVTSAACVSYRKATRAATVMREKRRAVLGPCSSRRRSLMSRRATGKGIPVVDEHPGNSTLQISEVSCGSSSALVSIISDLSLVLIVMTQNRLDRASLFTRSEGQFASTAIMKMPPWRWQAHQSSAGGRPPTHESRSKRRMDLRVGVARSSSSTIGPATTVRQASSNSIGPHPPLRRRNCGPPGTAAIPATPPSRLRPADREPRQSSR